MPRPSSRGVPADTSPEVFDVQVQRWRVMSELSDRQVRAELTRRRYGDGLAAAAFGPRAR
jgi:hypothetical protein